jgi:hypothetical protein
MGPFGESVYNSGNIRNVPVYDVKAGPAYFFPVSTPRNEGDGMLTFVDYLGKKRSI